MRRLPKSKELLTILFPNHPALGLLAVELAAQSNSEIRVLSLLTSV